MKERVVTAAVSATLACTLAHTQQPRPLPLVPAPVNPTLDLSLEAPLAAGPRYVRSGAAITFAARLLPADATGSVTFLVDGAAVQTVALTPQVLPDYIAIGDSITYAGYIADPAQRYQAVVANDLHLNLFGSYASPGYTACDAMLYNIVPNNVGTVATTHPLYSFMIGANDALYYGIGPNEAIFNLCHQATLSWLATPPDHKILAGDPAVSVRSGTWNSAPAFNNASLNALTSTGSGTLRFAMTTEGGAAYLWYLFQSNLPGSFTVSVDRGAPGPATSTLFPPTTQQIIRGSYALLRIPVAAGAHTFDITAQSGTVGILGMGTASSVPGANLTVVATDVPGNQTPGRAPILAEFSADIQANVTLLAADGLDLRFAQTRTYMQATNAEMKDAGHENPLGLAELAHAIEAVLPPTALPPDAITIPAASYATSSLPIGGHQIDAVYSGDRKYAPADRTLTGVVIYDASSTTTLNSSASSVPAQTPITFTATIPNPAAEGLVNFVDVTSSGTVTLGSAWMVQTTATLTLPGLSPGVHNVSAQYLGDVSYNASSSAPTQILVFVQVTATALTAPATRSFAGVPIPLTATLSPATATGTVTFFDGPAILGQAPVTSGSALLTSATLAPGSHALTASFVSNTGLDPSQSAVLTIEIDQNATIVVLAPLASTQPYGAPVALAASVAPAAATGTVTLQDSFVPAGQSTAIQQTLGRPTLSGGTASLSVANPAVGSHTFTAVYSGDLDDLPATSLALTTQIVPAASSTSLGPLPATAVYGTPLNLVASISPSTATGSVTFSDSLSGTLAQTPLGGGSSSYSATALSPGQHVLTATYSGDPQYASSRSVPATIRISPAPSTLTLAPLPASVNAGVPITLNASLLPLAATGTVLFRDAAQGVLGQATVSNGSASLTLASPALGSYALSASYAGDQNDAPALSNTVATQVTLAPTTLALSAGASSQAIGLPVTLTLLLTPAYSSGSVTFFDGSALLGTSLVSGGKAVFTAAALAVGLHPLHATYSGDTQCAPASSASINVTITGSVSITSLTLAQSTVAITSPVTANIRVATSNTTPGGTISLQSGGSVFASAPVISATLGTGYATLTFPSASLGIGSFPLTASYSGDPSDQPSTSPSAFVTVSPTPTSTTLSLSANQIPAQGGLTLTASIQAGGASLGGTVNFLRDGILIGSSAVNAAGTASLSFTSPTVGSFALTATYSGGGNFALSTSSPQLLTVTPPLAVALNPSTLQATPGSSQTATLTLTPLSGFTGSFQTTCSGSAPWVTCTAAAPTAVTSSVSLAVPVHIAISATSAAIQRPNVFRTAAGSALLALLLPMLLPRRRKRQTLGPLLALCFSLLFFAGCSSGGTFGSVPAGAQTVTVTVSAAGVASSSSLTIQIAP